MQTHARAHTRAHAQFQSVVFVSDITFSTFNTGVAIANRLFSYLLFRLKCSKSLLLLLLLLHFLIILTTRINSRAINLDQLFKWFLFRLAPDSVI